MKTYTAIVIREGRWWMIDIPELDGLTQARRLGEAELMAREYIAVTLDLKLSDVNVKLEVDGVEGVHDLVERIARIREEKSEAARLEADALEESTALAKELVGAEVPLRDAAEMLGISYQRVHQLVNA